MEYWWKSMVSLSGVSVARFFWLCGIFYYLFSQKLRFVYMNCRAARPYILRQFLTFKLLSYIFPKGQNLCVRPYIWRLFLTLLLWFVFLFKSFSHCTFCADRTNGRRLKGLKPKYQRTRHRVKIVAMFFAQELLCNIHRSNIACRSSLFVSVQALRDLCGYSVIKENITLPHFKHFLAYSWTETGFHSIFNSAVI